MLSTFERIMFLLLVAICLAAVANTFAQMARVIGRGQGALALNELPRRVIAGAIALITQGRIIRHRKITSLFHYGVAFGFIFYGLVNVIDILEGLVPGFTFLHDHIIGHLFRLAADLFAAAVLIGVVYFLLRRFAAQDAALKIRDNVKLMDRVRQGGIAVDSLIVGLFILFHVGSRLLSAAFKIGLEGPDPWQPVADFIAGTFLGGMSPEALTFGFHAFWWIALGLIFLFLPYFPYTKHAHLFMGPLNFMTGPERTYLGQMKKLNLDDETIEQFGANDLDDLPQKHILDAFACIMCNRCQQVCPAYNTGKELSPAALEINKRYYIREHMGPLAAGATNGVPLLDYAISESAVWACTACGHCIEICPVGNVPMLDIMEIRRDLVMMQSEFPDQLTAAFRGMERMGNPWQAQQSRMEWAAPLPFEVPTVEENPDYEYLLWVGCAGAFNPDAQKTVRAVATILHEAGVSFATLGDDETCTGDSARRAGNEPLFQAMAEANIETLNAARANERRIVTSCPHCFTTIGKEYGEMGGHYEVFHHTQLIADLVGRGKLRLNGKMLEQATFHDPCYLGRHNGVLAEPRTALAAAGLTLLEMPRSGKDSFCCGAGGAQYWKEEEHGTETVNVNRFREARATGAAVLAVGCPFCNTMMSDANREQGAPMQVRDVAELVAEALQPSAVAQ
ncbi:heterodisulfide reductase-related iron-sulfur binding cluster [Promineifilum sp.]|uniref:heterodisulfide reductase-related iron-sulfur binding cluster n=1 Tax=Promineifilum sp. TaxID=2664178 RepID=UPI0035AF0C05